MLDDRGPNNFKSTLRKTSSHAIDGGRVLNNKFNTIGSHRQKRVQFAINADIDHTQQHQLSLRNNVNNDNLNES